MGDRSSPAGAPGSRAADAAELDLRGEVCPYTFLRSRLALEALPDGGTLRVLVDNETSARDVPRSLDRAGHAVVAVRPVPEGAWVILVRKRSEEA
jgi:tRNA 2-thiouridine synthesizing protein A